MRVCEYEGMLLLLMIDGWDEIGWYGYRYVHIDVLPEKERKRRETP
jgi:hypothetical protein